jgi:hypothetical protein
MSGCLKEKICCQIKHSVTATRTNHIKHANHQKELPQNRSVGKSKGKEHGSESEQYTVREIGVYVTQGMPKKT